MQDVGKSTIVGAVAQLGEHLLCKQGVNGSIPFSSTIYTNQAKAWISKISKQTSSRLSLCDKQTLILELVSLPWRQATRLQRAPERVAATNTLPQTIFDN